MAGPRLLMTASLLAAAAGFSPVAAAETQVCDDSVADVVEASYENGRLCLAYNDGYTGFVQNAGAPSLPRSPFGGGTRDASAGCFFTAQPRESSLLITVRGSGQAHGAPRAVLTGVTCQVLDGDGMPVFDLTRAESGSVASLAGNVLVAKAGPFTLCASAHALFDDGEDVASPTTCVAPA